MPQESTHNIKYRCPKRYWAGLDQDLSQNPSINSSPLMHECWNLDERDHFSSFRQVIELHSFITASIGSDKQFGLEPEK